MRRRVRLLPLSWLPPPFHTNDATARLVLSLGLGKALLLFGFRTGLALKAHCHHAPLPSMRDGERDGAADGRWRDCCRQQLDEPPAGADGWGETGGGELKDEGVESGAAAHPLAPKGGARRGAVRTSVHSSDQTGRCVVADRHIAAPCPEKDNTEWSVRLLIMSALEPPSPRSS
jgi:hypothetical protein